METEVSVGVLWMVIGIAGFLIITMVGIIGFFLKRVLKELKDDVKKNNEENGKNKGRIELVEQQQIADTKRIEAMTQLELKVLSSSVRDLTNTVNAFVGALIKKGIGDE
jgi:hypothetical protein